MSETMIERVARAICKAMGYEPDAADFDTLPDNESIDGWRNWFGFKSEARAAIEAMRLPTTEMCWAMSKNGAEGNDDELRSDWSAAVDAALSHDEVKG